MTREPIHLHDLPRPTRRIWKRQTVHICRGCECLFYITADHGHAEVGPFYEWKSLDPLDQP